MKAILFIEKKNRGRQVESGGVQESANAPASREFALWSRLAAGRAVLPDALSSRFVNTANFRFRAKTLLRFSELFHKIKSLPPARRQFVFFGFVRLLLDGPLLRRI